MDVNQYLEIFIDETKEHIQNLNDQLMIIEKEPDNKDTINEIFRAAHSLKGMAGTMGYKRMQRLTHDMENVFSEIRNDKMKVTSSLIDVLFQSLDAIEAYLNNIQENADEGTDDNEPIIQELNRILREGIGASAPVDKEIQAVEVATQIQTPAAANAPKEYAMKFKDIVPQEHEKHAIAEAFAEGKHVFGISVYIQETCILKAARAFLVFKSLEELGDIICSVPGVQEIEDEKFGLDFSLYIVTDAELDKVLAAVKSVSEIEEAVGQEYEEKKETGKEEHKEDKAEIRETSRQETSASSASSKASSSKTAPAKNSGKPVVNRTVRVDIEKLDSLMNQVSELIIAKNSLVSISENENESSQAGMQGFREQIEYLERITTSIHESVMKVRMVPIESVVSKFPRMIRDLNKKLNKKMQLYMTGEETELDRSVIDQIGDPLMHLLRNSADHGLESAEVRLQRGKPEEGSIFLDAYQDGNNVVIEVRDDGNGIDVAAVKAKAVEPRQYHTGTGRYDE